MSIENQQQLKEHLYDALGLMKKVIANANMGDIEAVEELILSVQKSAGPIGSRNDGAHLSVAADPSRNVI